MISSWRSIFALVVFFLTNLAAVFPLHIPVPLPAPTASFVAKIAVYLRVCFASKSCCAYHPTLAKNSGGRGPFIHWHRFVINFQTAPPMAVLLLLATQVLDGTDVKHGIVGTGGVKPISIMALFMSLAYLSISLDTTGLFRFLAFWVVRKGGDSGRRLYFYLYLFFFVSGVAVGNDPVVLFGTPFLAYFSHVSGIAPPTAWIFAQFSAANMASAVLPPSNLTNLVLTGAFSISFITYSAHTILPALAAAAAVYPLLAFGLFASKDLVPREISVVIRQGSVSEAPQTSAEEVPSSENLEGSARVSVRSSDSARGAGVSLAEVLNDRNGAIFGSVLLAAALAVLVGTSLLKIPVWEVTVPPAVIMLARDVWHDRKRWRKKQSTEQVATCESGDCPGVELEALPTHSSVCKPQEAYRAEKGHQTLLSAIYNWKQDTLPTLFNIVPRLPVSLVIFAFSMFVLVQALTTRGWVEVFAGWWAAWIRVCARAGSGSAIVGAIGGMFLISVLLCNMCGTNIGTTILLTRVLQVWINSSASSGVITHGVKLGSIYALALGTNFGAFTFSFSASLAGLLWRDILLQKGIAVQQKQFALLNLPIIAVATLSAASVLVAEMFVVKQ